jgi:transposase
MSRKPYTTDVSDEEWSFAAPYLTLINEYLPKRPPGLREVFNALHWVVRSGVPFRLVGSVSPLGARP